MPFLGIYSWSQFTIPAGIPTGDLTGDTQPNDPTAPGYDPGSTSWIGETFTFNGGAPTQIDINDDDSVFEDGYVETGGAQTLNVAVTIDGTLYPAGSVVENEFSLIDAGGNEIYVVRINGENVGFTYQQGQEPTLGETFTATVGLDGDPADNADGLSSSTEPYANVICFAAGTMIDTTAGLKAVEQLEPGDHVITADIDSQPVLWVGQTPLTFTADCANTKPVLLPAGCLGQGIPKRDLIVSQQHRMLLQGAMVEKKFGTPSVFAPAKGLLPLKGVRIMKGKKAITYVHLLLPCHSVIFAEGAPSESFYPGPVAMQAMLAEQRESVLSLFPALRTDPVHGYGRMARTSLSTRIARDFATEMRKMFCDPKPSECQILKAA